MLEYQDKIVQVAFACTCDRCRRRWTPDDYDWHEKLSIAYRGGFNSIFGDGCEISVDLCQQCVKETLGAWLRTTPPGMDWPTLEGADGLEYQECVRTEWEGREGATRQPLDELRGSVRRYDNPTNPVWPEAEKGHVNPVLRRLQENMKAKTRRDPPPAHEADDWIEVWELGDEITQPSVKTWVPKADYFAFQALRFPHLGAGDHASRALDVQTLANEVFDDPAAAMQWLLSATPLLDDMRPIDALATEQGYDRVRTLLLRLVYGISV